MKTNYTSFLILLALVFSGMFTLSTPVQAALVDIQVCENSLFDGGDGTSESPWEISNPQQLANVTFCSGIDYDDSYFILTGNIDLEGFVSSIEEQEDGNGWMPIGAYVDDVSYVEGSFYGNFNGNGYSISGVTIDRDSTEYSGGYADDQGLFGALRDAQIYDLGITDFSVSGVYAVGSLAGIVESGTTISRTYATEGTLLSTNSSIGGLVGQLESQETTSSIIDSYALDVIINAYGSASVGGLAGYISDDSIVNKSYTATTLYLGDTSIPSIGGLVGGGESSDYQINDSFSVSSIDVDGSAFEGGVAGKWGETAGTNNFYWGHEGSPEVCVGNQDYTCGIETELDYFKNITSEPIASWDVRLVDNAELEGYNEGLPFLLRSVGIEDEDYTWGLYGADEPVVPEEPRRRSSGGKKKIPAALAETAAPTVTNTSDTTTVDTTGNTTSNTEVSTGVRDLTLTFEGDDVKRLQEILIAQNVGPMAQALAGIGATGYFGSYTRDALAEYQAPNGIVPAIGYFGVITRTQMTTAGISGLWW